LRSTNAAFWPQTINTHVFKIKLYLIHATLKQHAFIT